MSGVRAAVDWRSVGLFYGIAFGGAVLVALLVWLGRDVAGWGALFGIIVTAVCYMPLPLVAGLITERVAKRRPLIGREWQALRKSFWRTYARNAVVAIAVVLAIVALGFAAAWGLAALGVPGVGHLVATDAELLQRVQQINPQVAAGSLPPAVVLFVATLVQGVIAGLTINALFAFGEEYGWRGVLADALRPLGLGWASLITGVLWGLWHAPIIVLGHNYGAEWAWGIPVMVTWTVPFAFVLSWTRERTGSVLAPAILHGAFNGVVGVFALFVIGGNVLIGLPVGLVLSAVLAVVALVVWRIPASVRAAVVADEAAVVLR